MTDLSVDVHNLKGEVIDKVELDASIFQTDVRGDIMSRVVRFQMAKRQQGSHKVKNISERSGTGKKPFPQKGTGNARQGTMRAPHMRGGGRVHGPVVRSHAHKLNKKEILFGVRSSLAARHQEGRLIVVNAGSLYPSTNDQDVDDPSVDLRKKKLTQQMLSFAKALELRRPLFITSSFTASTDLGSRKVNGWKTILAQHTSVLHVIRNKEVVITLQALEAVTERYRKEEKTMFPPFHLFDEE